MSSPVGEWVVWVCLHGGCDADWASCWLSWLMMWLNQWIVGNVDRVGCFGWLLCVFSPGLGVQWVGWLYFDLMVRGGCVTGWLGMGLSQSVCVVLAGCWFGQWIVCVCVCGGGGGGGWVLTELDDIDDDLVCVHWVVEAWVAGCVCVCGGGGVCVRGRGILGLVLLLTELDDDVLAEWWVDLGLVDGWEWGCWGGWKSAEWMNSVWLGHWSSVWLGGWMGGGWVRGRSGVLSNGWAKEWLSERSKKKSEWKNDWVGKWLSLLLS